MADQDSRTGEQETPGRRSVVHGSAHEVPYLRQTLPLIDEHGSLASQQTRWVSLGNGQLGRVIQTVRHLRALQRCAGLPDALGAFDGDRGQVAEQFVNFIVDHTTLVGREDAHPA